jgi:hypothetical protein
MTPRAPSTAVLDQIAVTTAAGFELESRLTQFCAKARDTLRAFDCGLGESADCLVEGVSEPIHEIHALIARMQDACSALFRDAIAGGTP